MNEDVLEAWRERPPYHSVWLIQRKAPFKNNLSGLMGGMQNQSMGSNVHKKNKSVTVDEQGAGGEQGRVIF